MSVLCCHVPDFLLTLACRTDPGAATRPFALLGPDERVCAASAPARQSGVREEMPVRQAQMRCPDIELEPLEIMMITFHMGVYGLNEFYSEDDWQSGEYPLIGDHSECEGLSKEESQAKRYGQSLRNAWYHNEIVKFMYFADEMATMEEKCSTQGT